MGVEDIAALFSNVFAIVVVRSEFVLTFGIATPPIMQGPLTQDEDNEIVMKLKPVVRIGMSPQRVVELIGLLQSQLRAYTQMEVEN